MTPNESSREHVANVIQAFAMPLSMRDQDITFTPSEAAAICVRLRKVLAELEGHRENMGVLGVGTLPADATIHLRAVGDHVERVYPETGGPDGNV